MTDGGCVCVCVMVPQIENHVFISGCIWPLRLWGDVDGYDDDSSGDVTVGDVAGGMCGVTYGPCF